MNVNMAASNRLRSFYMQKTKGEENTMKNTFAYVCTPENYTLEKSIALCRELYRMGYVPICPALAISTYINIHDPVQREDKNAWRTRCCDDAVCWWFARIP